MTQRTKINSALLSHGCKPVDHYAHGWVEWTTGDLFPEGQGFPDKSIYVGQGSVRVGRTRTSSKAWPKLMEFLLNEPVGTRL